MNGCTDLKVLILEDNLFQRQVLAAVLRSLGVRHIVEAGDGFAGLAAMRAADDAFDLVISDLGMEGMDGLEFLKHAGEFGIGGLILCSGQDAAVLSSAEWMARAYSAPVLGVIGKPIDRALLASLIARLGSTRNLLSDVFGGDREDTDADELVDAIRNGLDLGQFAPFYQPKVSLQDGALVGVEVLARWLHPERGTLPPVHFVDMMERFDLIEALTYAMLEQACADARAWAKGGIDVPFSINISPRTLEQPGCAARLLAKIATCGVAPDQVTMEITEQAFSADPRRLMENALRLRVHGCHLSVDDYGVGYSSLQQISRVPVTELKLDRSFVRNLPADRKAMSIVESTIALAKKLNLKTVAEGVESHEQADSLRRLGCDVGQGYLFGRPMDAPAFVRWHAAHAGHPVRSPGIAKHSTIVV